MSDFASDLKQDFDASTSDGLEAYWVLPVGDPSSIPMRMAIVVISRGRCRSSD
jgi:hypothetical protein